jgi:hypothetical protein
VLSQFVTHLLDGVVISHFILQVALSHQLGQVLEPKSHSSNKAPHLAVEFGLCKYQSQQYVNLQDGVQVHLILFPEPRSHSSQVLSTPLLQEEEEEEEDGHLL